MARRSTAVLARVGLAVLVTIGGAVFTMRDSSPPAKLAAPATLELNTHLAAAGGAPTGKTLHFQGVLSDPSTGNPLQGSFNMGFGMFAVETAGTALWSESQPNVQVRKGVFSVQLGSVTDFPVGLFDNSPLYIEMSVGTGGPLTPRVLIARTGNAFHADKADDVKNDAITKDKIKNLAVEREKIQENAVNENKLENGAVGRGKIKDKAVGRGQVDDKAISTVQLDDKAVSRGQVGDKAVGKDQLDDKSVGNGKLEDGAVDKDKIADGSVTNPKLADDAVTTGKIEDGTITADDLGSGSVNSDEITDGTITEDDLAAGAVGADELADEVLTFIRESPGARAPFGITYHGENINNAGPPNPASVVVGTDGLPVIAVGGLDSGDGAGVGVIHCDDAACSTSTITQLTTNGFTGRPGLAVATDGLLRVFHATGTVKCLNATCSDHTSVPSALGGANDYKAVVGGDGRVFVLAGLTLLRCEDDDCAGGVTIPGGGFEDIAMGADGRLITVEQDGNEVRVRRCNDVGCDSIGAEQVASTETSSTNPRITVSGEGLPFISYIVDGSQLVAVNCTTVDCSGADDRTVLPVSLEAAGVTPHPSADGSVLMVSTRVVGGGGALTITRCNRACLEGTTTAEVGPEGTRTFHVGYGAAVTIGADGYPFIVQPVNDGQAKLATVHCSNRFCVPYFREH